MNAFNHSSPQRTPLIRKDLAEGVSLLEGGGRLLSSLSKSYIPNRELFHKLYSHPLGPSLWPLLGDIYYTGMHFATGNVFLFVKKPLFCQ